MTRNPFNVQPTIPTNGIVFGNCAPKVVDEPMTEMRHEQRGRGNDERVFTPNRRDGSWTPDQTNDPWARNGNPHRRDGLRSDQTDDSWARNGDPHRRDGFRSDQTEDPWARKGDSKGRKGGERFTEREEAAHNKHNNGKGKPRKGKGQQQQQQQQQKGNNADEWDDYDYDFGGEKSPESRSYMHHKRQHQEEEDPYRRRHEDAPPSKGKGKGYGSKGGNNGYDYDDGSKGTHKGGKRNNVNGIQEYNGNKGRKSQGEHVVLKMREGIEDSLRGKGGKGGKRDQNMPQSQRFPQFQNLVWTPNSNSGPPNPRTGEKTSNVLRNPRPDARESIPDETAKLVFGSEDRRPQLVRDLELRKRKLLEQKERSMQSVVEPPSQQAAEAPQVAKSKPPPPPVPIMTSSAKTRLQQKIQVRRGSAGGSTAGTLGGAPPRPASAGRILDASRIASIITPSSSSSARVKSRIGTSEQGDKDMRIGGRGINHRDVTVKKTQKRSTEDRGLKKGLILKKNSSAPLKARPPAAASAPSAPSAPSAAASLRGQKKEGEVGRDKERDQQKRNESPTKNTRIREKSSSSSAPLALNKKTHPREGGSTHPMTVPTPSKESKHHGRGDSSSLRTPRSPLVPRGLPSPLISDDDGVGMGLMGDGDNPGDLTYGLTGTLDAMCSEAEMAMRQECRQMDRFELTLASTLLNPVPEPKLCVKKYQRSAADKQYNDNEIRTFEACGRSMDHLLDKVLHIDELKRKSPPFAEICQDTTFVEIYSFFRDRMRAIRVDLHVQQPRSLSRPIYFLIHEQCLRFELLSMFLLRRPDVTLTQYDEKLGVKACSQAIEPLLHAYSRYPSLQATPSCAAMYRYIILLQIGSSEWLSFSSKLPREVVNHHLVKWALTAAACFCAEDYTGYLRMYQEADFLSGVIMGRMVDFVRYRVLFNILRSLVMNAKEISWTVSQLQACLAIEDREFCVSFLEYYGIWVEDEKVRFPRRLGISSWDVAEWEEVLDAETAARFRDRIGSGVKPMDSSHFYPRNQDYALARKYKDLGLTRAAIVRGECDPTEQMHGRSAIRYPITLPTAAPPRSRSSAYSPSSVRSLRHKKVRRPGSRCPSPPKSPVSVSACSSDCSVVVSVVSLDNDEEETENDEEEDQEGEEYEEEYEDSPISTSIRKVNKAPNARSRSSKTPRAESGSGVIATSSSSMPSTSSRASPRAAAAAAGAGITSGSYPPSGGLINNNTGINNPFAAPEKPHAASSSNSISPFGSGAHTPHTPMPPAPLFGDLLGGHGEKNATPSSSIPSFSHLSFAPSSSSAGFHGENNNNNNNINTYEGMSESATPKHNNHGYSHHSNTTNNSNSNSFTNSFTNNPFGTVSGRESVQAEHRPVSSSSLMPPPSMIPSRSNRMNNNSITNMSMSQPMEVEQESPGMTYPGALPQLADPVRERRREQGRLRKAHLFRLGRCFFAWVEAHRTEMKWRQLPIQHHVSVVNNKASPRGGPSTSSMGECRSGGLKPSSSSSCGDRNIHDHTEGNEKKTMRRSGKEEEKTAAGGSAEVLSLPTGAILAGQELHRRMVLCTTATTCSRTRDFTLHIERCVRQTDPCPELPKVPGCTILSRNKGFRRYSSLVSLGQEAYDSQAQVWNPYIGFVDVAVVVMGVPVPIIKQVGPMVEELGEEDRGKIESLHAEEILVVFFLQASSTKHEAAEVETTRTTVEAVFKKSLPSSKRVKARCVGSILGTTIHFKGSLFTGVLQRCKAESAVEMLEEIKVGDWAFRIFSQKFFEDDLDTGNAFAPKTRDSMHRAPYWPYSDTWLLRCWDLTWEHIRDSMALEYGFINPPPEWDKEDFKVYKPNTINAFPVRTETTPVEYWHGLERDLRERYQDVVHLPRRMRARKVDFARVDQVATRTIEMGRRKRRSRDDMHSLMGDNMSRCSDDRGSIYGRSFAGSQFGDSARDSRSCAASIAGSMRGVGRRHQQQQHQWSMNALSRERPRDANRLVRGCAADMRLKCGSSSSINGFGLSEEGKIGHAAAAAADSLFIHSLTEWEKERQKKRSKTLEGIQAIFASPIT